MESNEVLAKILMYILVHFSTWILIYSRPTSFRLHNRHNVDIRSLKHELATRVVSSIHASVTFISSLYYLVNESKKLTYSDMLQIKNNNIFFQNLCCYSSAFFICDIMICSILFKENGPMFLIHALAGFIGTMYGSLLNESHIFIALLFLWEGSTPFLNLRWVLMEYGLKNSLAFKITNILLVTLFITFRIVLGIPITLYLVYLLIHHEELSPYIRAMMSSACISTIYLNFNWGYTIGSKALSLMRSKESKTK